jgi:hypothetical protein
MAYNRASSLTPELRSNFFHLYADLAWFGVLSGSILSFLAVYVARIGGTGFQVGLLSAGPAAINLLFSLPSGRWLENRPLIRVSFLSALLSRFGYLLLLGLPVLFGYPAQIWGIVLLSLALSVPGTILNIAFNAMFAGVVPPEWRSHVIGRRNALSAVCLMITSLACGVILDRVVFPLNYQIVFGIGWLGAMASVYHLSQIKVGHETLGRRPFFSAWPPTLPTIRNGRLIVRLRKGLRGIGVIGRAVPRLDPLRGPFGRIMAAYLIFYTFQYLPLPLFTLYSVNSLGLTDGAISVGTALFQLMIVVFSLMLARLSARFSQRQQLIASALLFGQYPLLLFFAHNATLYWVASVTGGSIYAVLNGGLLNRLMECVPSGDRPAHMALHNLAFNLGILSGSLFGPLLGIWIGLRPALLVSAGLRFLAGVIMWVWV